MAGVVGGVECSDREEQCASTAVGRVVDGADAAVDMFRTLPGWQDCTPAVVLEWALGGRAVAGHRGGVVLYDGEG